SCCVNNAVTTLSYSSATIRCRSKSQSRAATAPRDSLRQVKDQGLCYEKICHHRLREDLNQTGYYHARAGRGRFTSTDPCQSLRTRFRQEWRPLVRKRGD